MDKLKKSLFWILPSLLALVWAIPLFWMIVTAFTNPTYRMTLFPSTGFTLDNLRYVWEAVPFDAYYKNTIFIVVVTFCVQFVLSTLAAYALAVLDFKGQLLVYVIIFLQIIIPNDVLIIPNYMTISDLGLVDTKLGIMIPFFGSALAIFLLRQTFKSIPKSLTEAAILDGASIWTIIWKIYMPNAKSAYLSFAVISISYHWNNYLWPLIVTNSVENRPLTVGLAIFAKSKEANMQWANVTAATFLIILPLLVAFFIFQRQFIESLTHSGVKE
ncbi:carbohydrate ABC transporter permease [Allofustis seminis]|uniref:carbohydrate ABC transporter permease n=1 Tax=Allofustis seminis TaxID=166939 RepID=UPI00036C5F65|nr:carbohydrate ABC transporter permease [Allofustis seminis]